MLGLLLPLTALVVGLSADPPTYHRDVAPILQAKCQSCHRPGQIGPFSLLDYASAKRWSSTMAEVVEEGLMPPWHAEPGYAVYRNDRSLRPEQRAALLAWIRAGCPEGDPKDGPPPRAFPSGDWQIGEPDAVFTMPEPFAVKAEGTLPYQWFAVPTGFTEDKWVQALEVKPGHRGVVHHILVFVADDAGRRLQDRLADGGEAEAGPGGGQLAGYVPGDEATVFPPGVAKKIPAGSTLIFQVHYTPVGKAVTDRSGIALKFAEGPVVHKARTIGISSRALNIPPNDPNYEASASLTVPADATLLSIWPHMHLRGKDFRLTVTTPGGTPEVLLNVPRYDFNWQSTYTLDEPRKLPRGTRIDCLAHFDNSAANPNNPDPSKTVRWGPQTTDEMMIGFVDYYFNAGVEAGLARRNRNPAAAPGGGRLAAALRDRLGAAAGDASPRERAERAFAFYDKDRDGVIREDELPNRPLFAWFDLDDDGAITVEETTQAFRRIDRLRRPDGDEPTTRKPSDGSPPSGR